MGIFHNKPKMVDPFYGEWSFGCYHKLWRVLSDNQIILEGQNDFDNYKETDSLLQQISFGRLIDITVVNTLDIAMIFDNNIRLEFLVSRKEENTFDVFYLRINASFTMVTKAASTAEVIYHGLTI